MKQIHLLLSGLTIIAIFAALTLIASVPAAAAQEVCSSGAHTLSKFGDRVYPEMGNGGYTSVHSDIYIVYDAATNMFLSGTHVDLTQQATQWSSDPWGVMVRAVSMPLRMSSIPSAVPAWVRKLALARRTSVQVSS